MRTSKTSHERGVNDVVYCPTHPPSSPSRRWKNCKRLKGDKLKRRRCNSIFLWRDRHLVRSWEEKKSKQHGYVDLRVTPPHEERERKRKKNEKNAFELECSLGKRGSEALRKKPHSIFFLPFPKVDSSFTKHDQLVDDESV